MCGEGEKKTEEEEEKEEEEEEEMEPRHKELLEKCYQNLLESITEADQVVEILAHCGTLSQSERYELGHSCCSSSEKVDLLLKILLSKERDCFAELCAALEKTHPHLHSVLLNGTGPVDHTTGESDPFTKVLGVDAQGLGSGPRCNSH